MLHSVRSDVAVKTGIVRAFIVVAFKIIFFKYLLSGHNAKKKDPVAAAVYETK